MRLMQRSAPTVLVVFATLLGMAVAVSACPTDPNADVFPTYYNEARQILDSHSQLGQKYRSFNSSENADDATEAMKFVKETAAPGLGKLAANAARMSFPQAPEIGSLNRQLVDALTAKYEGYRKMVEGWEKSDLKQFSEGRKEAFQATQELLKYERELELWRRNGGRRPTQFPE